MNESKSIQIKIKVIVTNNTLYVSKSFIKPVYCCNGYDNVRDTKTKSDDRQKQKGSASRDKTFVTVWNAHPNGSLNGHS